MSPAHPYRGRFAPSPTGTLHAGSLVAALGSWLDARAHGGTWLVRIEDLDPPREMPGAIDLIIDTLGDFGLVSDESPRRQSERGACYDAALQTLLAAGFAFPCACSRRDVDAATARLGLPAGVYAGTCRAGIAPGARSGRACRLRVPDAPVAFVDRRCGRFAQRLAHDVGDFVLKRSDGLWAYQLAVVVDDAEQGVTDIVRGADLLDNTPRQIWLQRCLGVGTPRYLHLPVVTDAQGEKLSKQTGAAPLDRGDVLGELERAWLHLGFPRLGARSHDAFLSQAVEHWRARWPAPGALLQSRP